MERDSSDVPPNCSNDGCTRDVEFFVYDAESGDWCAVCAPHARHLHPSLEVHVWLESGYMKPAELGRPDAAPSPPRSERGAEFRAEVEETMGWST